MVRTRQFSRESCQCFSCFDLTESATKTLTYSSNTRVSLCEFAHFLYHNRATPLRTSYIMHIHQKTYTILIANSIS